MHVCRMVEKDDFPSPDISKIADASKVTVEEDFLNLTPITTIEGLKDCAEVIEKISFLYIVFIWFSFFGVKSIIVVLFHEEC